MADHPGIEVELLPGAGTSVPLPARSGDGQDSGEEKGCTAVSQRLVHQMKVAVRAATGERAYLSGAYSGMRFMGDYWVWCAPVDSRALDLASTSAVRLLAAALDTMRCGW